MNIFERFKKAEIADKFARPSRGWLLPGLLLLAVWALAIRQSDLEWTINPQYQYGWFVPFLTLLLWWRAWGRRPPPGVPVAPVLLPVLVIIFAILAFPLRIIEEANPDWRLLNYYFVGQAVLVTILMVDYSGGRAWLRHFAFPLLFPLVAIPWPSGPERDLIQGLQRCIASIGVEGASWMGWSAFQRGNLIVLSHGIIGVNEACSGIRSLQSSLMIALFLGDYFQLTTLRRWILIGFALALAFIFNAARAFILILVMELQGAVGMMKFHDPAGFSISLASLLVLWAAASFMGSPDVAASGKSRSRAEIMRFPSGWLITLLLAWLGAEMLNQGWYLWCERNSVPGPVWNLRWPPHPNFKEEAIDDVARTYLRYDYGVHGTWNDQYQWEIFFFTWNPSRAAAGLAESHHPDICLPAVGYILKQELPIEKMNINGMDLPVTRYIFQDPFDGSLLYAFEAVTDDRIRPDLPDEHIDGASRLRRLHMAWIGKRNPGQRSLLIVNRGADNLEEAENGVRSLLTEALITSQ